jgi:hypothetical protein
LPGYFNPFVGWLTNLSLLGAIKIQKNPEIEFRIPEALFTQAFFVKPKQWVTCHTFTVKKIPRPPPRARKSLIVNRVSARDLPAKSARGGVSQKGIRAAPGATCNGQYVAFVNKNQNPQMARRVQGNNLR